MRSRSRSISPHAATPFFPSDSSISSSPHPMIASLVLAVRFLTVVPVPGRETVGPGALGRAAWWFPVVGLALGLALTLVDRALNAIVAPLTAAVLVLAF